MHSDIKIIHAQAFGYSLELAILARPRSMHIATRGSIDRIVSISLSRAAPMQNVDRIAPIVYRAARARELARP